MGAELVQLPSLYAPPGFVLLAHHDGKPVGCVGVRVLDPDTGEIRRLFVKPSCRRQGLGRELLGAATGQAQATGATRLVLTTLPSMTAARRLYDEDGYTPIDPYVSDPITGVQYLGRSIQRLSCGSRTRLT